MSDDKMVLTYDEMCKLNDKWDTIVKERDKQSATLRKRIAELEAQIEAMRERDVTAIFRGLPVLVNKYLPKRTLMVSEDLAETLQM